MDYAFTIDGKYYNTLEIESFSRMMDSPSFCYKFYWLDAITTLITENCTQTTFNDIIDEMIADAWYSVIEFHIHLSGIVYKDKDNLEKAVTLLQEHADLPSNASKTEIKNGFLWITTRRRLPCKTASSALSVRRDGAVSTRLRSPSNSSSVRESHAVITRL